MKRSQHKQNNKYLLSVTTRSTETGPEVEAILRHRSSVVAELAPTEAEAKEHEGGGGGLGPHDLGHESFSAVQLLLEFPERKIW